MNRNLIRRTWKGLFFGLVAFGSGFVGLAADFVNPYADFGVSESVSNQVKTLTWCSLGTSITDFDNDPAPGRTQGYQSYTMELLGWDHAKLLNIGHSGSTVGLANDFPKTTPYDIYTVEFGINDWSTGHIVGTLSDYENYKYGNAVRWHNFAACYRYVIEGIRAANPNAIIVLTTPRKGYGYNGKLPDNCDDLTLESSMTDVNYWDPETQGYLHERTRLADYAALIRQIAAKENLVLCDWYAYAADQDNLAELSVDTALHPNDEGYRIMAQMLAPKILAAVKAANLVPDPSGPTSDPAVGPVAQLRNISCVVAVGSELTLPSTVKGLDAKGAVVGDVAVTWPNATVSYDVPDVYTVVGRATSDATKKVSASIRAVKLTPGENVTPQAASIATTDSSNPNATTLKRLGGDAPAETSVDWVTSNRREGNLVDTLAWDEEVTLARLKICYSGSHTAPTSYAFSGDGKPIAVTAGEVESVGVHRWVEFTFDKPQKLTTLTCTFGGGANWLIVERIWAYTEGGGSSGAVTPNTAATLKAVTVDGVTYADFNPAMYHYAVVGETIGAEATDNAAVTILPKTDDFVRVVTLSEDGLTSLTYTFETTTVRYLRNVAVPAGRGQAPSLPPVVKGLSALGSVLVDVPVVWDDVPPPATAVLYAVNGHATDNPSLTVSASVRVVEPTGEASASENVALKSNGGSATMVIKDTADETRTKEQAYLVDELIPETPDWGGRAPSRPNSGKTNCDVELTLAFGKTEQIARVCVFYEVNEKQNYGLPSGVAFYDESGNAIACGEPTVSDFSDMVKKYEYSFVTPKALGKVKIVFECKTAKYFSLIETEAWSTGAAVADLTPLAGARPGMIKVDGRDLDGYDPDVLAYKARSGTVTATFGTEANANMGITVLPRHDKVTRVIALSEDGQTMRTYELTSKPGLVIVFR